MTSTISVRRCRDTLSTVLIRNPIELRYWGKTLDLDKELKFYAVKEQSEIQVHVKPKIPEGQPVPAGCMTVFRKGDDWEARLRTALEQVSRARPSARL